MDEVSSLRCRNAALETELRLVKDQLMQSQNGGMYLVSLLGHQVTPTPHAGQQKEITTLRAQLNATLQCNTRLERRLAASRETIHGLEEKEDTRSIERFGALSRADIWRDDFFRPQSFVKVGNDHKDQGSDLLGEMGDKESQHRLAPALEPATEFVSARDQRTDSWVKSSGKLRVDAYDQDLSEEEASSLASPASERGIRDGWAAMEKKKIAAANVMSRDGSFATTDSSSSNPLFETALQNIATEVSTNDDQEQSSGIAEPEPLIEGIRIEGSNGNVFYVIPPPPTEPRWMAEAKRVPGYSMIHVAPLKYRFYAHEHNRLSGQACWIEDYTEEEYAAYWDEYEKGHRDHSADEWREYYEAEVRPAYREKLARKDRESAPSPDQRRDSGNVSLDEVEVEVSGQEAAAADDQSIDEEDQVHVETMEASQQRVSNDPTTVDDSGALTSDEAEWLADDQQEQQHEQSHDATLAVPNIVPGEFPEDSVPPTPSIDNQPPRYSTDQLVEARAFAKSVSKNGIRTAPDNADVIEMGTARPVHMRSYSKDDVKQCEIRSSSSKSSSSPVPVVGVAKRSRWPAPEPRPNFAAGRSDQRPNRNEEISPQEEEVKWCFDSTDAQLQRTVLIGNIPVGTALAEVLDQVSGGRVIRARYIDTVGMKTLPPLESNTVLVEFFCGRNAQAYQESCSQQAISFPLANGMQQEAHVSLIRTPTRPIPENIFRAMQHGDQSRVLFVHDHRGEMTAEYLIAKCCPIFRISYGHQETQNLPVRHVKEDGLVTLEFAAVNHAMRSYRALLHNPELSGMDIGFLPDPCFRARPKDVAVDEGGE